MVKKNTEEKIVQAAEKVFIEKGLAGARMQEIADEAGINKALLHYYYRSKEKLFEMVFKMAFRALAPNLLKAFNGSEDFFTKIEHFVSSYLTIIDKNPHIPGFIINELSSNPDRLETMVTLMNLDFQPIYNAIEDEIKKKTIRPIEPSELILNVLALCIFPIVAKPMIKGILFKGSEEKYKLMLEKRKKEVAHFVISSIKITD
ncbi:MAG: TetR/AcrR family transcriptional regulator [Bacteroidetes bacterium]|nr:MAG: TetR/AcrR family transcriptional regulator [Bacteroidota bacterium]